jgi:molybdate transport system regulatory protein
MLAAAMVKLTIRIDLSDTAGLGPGKIRLLEQIGETGSISAAGRALNMSYRRAWLLVDELNHLFKEPVATTAHGGKTGGGAQLTEFGRSLVRRYRAMEDEAHSALSKHLAALRSAASPRARRSPGTPKRTSLAK